MLARLRIGPKLLLAPGVVLVLLVLLSCGAYVAMVRQNASLDTIVQQRAAHLRAASSLVASAQRAHAQAYQILTWISGSFPRARVDPLVRDVIELAQEDQSVSATAMAKAERAFGVVAERVASLAITMAVRRSLLGEIGAIESAASSLASGDLTVRASLEQTATSMQDLAATMMETADSARRANRLAESATAAAQQGGSVVHRLVATLDSVRRAAVRMDELGESVEDACSRAGNLALGAAVEAAQGGTQAWQFAQAACEVRALAGSAVAGAREARAENLAGVNQAIVRMDELTQQGTRMAEDAAMAARTLQQQALSLSQAVAAFRLDEVVQAPPEAGHENGAAGALDKRPGSPGHPYLRLASSRRGKD